MQAAQTALVTALRETTDIKARAAIKRALRALQDAQDAQDRADGLRW